MSVRKIRLVVASLGLLACMSLLIAVVWPRAATFRGHMGRVYAVAASPDGKTLASISSDKKIKLWDVASRTVRATLPGSDVPFCLDGKTFAWAQGKTIRLWDMDAGKECGILRGHTDSVCCLTISADGKTLASGSCDKTVKLWDLAPGKERASYRGHSSFVGAVAFSPDGNTLASRGYGSDEPINLWDVSMGKKRAAFAVHEWSEGPLAFSPDGKTLASSGASISLLDLPTGTILATLETSGEGVESLVFSPDGKSLAAVNADSPHEVYLWDILSGTRTTVALERSYRRPRPRLFRYVWDTFPGIFQDHAFPLSVGFRPDGKLVVFGVDVRDETTVKMWRINKEY